MKHCLYCKYLHLHLHFSTTVGTIPTSPKIYKKVTCVCYELTQKLINTVCKITLYGDENICE